MKVLSCMIFTLFFFISIASAETDIENYLVDVDVQYQYFNSGIDKVDCVYIINLENRPKKWIEAKSSLELYGIHPNRVQAVNGWALSEDDKQKLAGNYPVRMRGGQMGCILSHISVHRDAFKKGYDTIWICEDDIEICENPHQISDILSALSKIDPDWDILYTDFDTKNSEGASVPSLSSDFRPDFPCEPLSYYIKREPVAEDILRIRQRFGAYSMIVSKKGVASILNYFMKNYIWTAYDIDIHYIPNIRQYCVNRDLVSIDYKKPSDTEWHCGSN